MPPLSIRTQLYQVPEVSCCGKKVSDVEEYEPAEHVEHIEPVIPIAENTDYIFKKFFLRISHNRKMGFDGFGAVTN